MFQIFEEKLSDSQSSAFKTFGTRLMAATFLIKVILFNNKHFTTLLFVFGLISLDLSATYRQSGLTDQGFLEIYVYWNRVFGSLVSLSHCLRGLSRGLVETEKLIQFFDEPVSVVDSPNARPLDVKNGIIAFHGVEFSYGAGTALRGLDVELPRGLVGIVGENGSGKTTLVRLLFRFWDVTRGAITIDGQDIRSVSLESLRNNIGVVMQVVSLRWHIL